MSSFGLAWKTARRYKARAVLAIAGVAIIGALNFDMLLLSKGLLLSFADMINAQGFDVRVVGSAGLPAARLPIAEASRLLDEIRRLPVVEEAAMVRGEAASILVPGRPPTAGVLFGTDHRTGAGAWTLVRGTGFEHVRSGAVISTALASAFGVEPGMTLRVKGRLSDRLSALPPLDVTVTGVGDFRFEAAQEFIVATTLETLSAAFGGLSRDEADLVLVASRARVSPERTAAAIRRVRPDVRAFSNQDVVENFNRNNFAYFRQISTVLSATTGAFTFLLVATLLTVSVNQRLGEVAALRALGISRQRIGATLLWESALLVGAGGALAIPIGLALARVLDDLLRRMPRLPAGAHFFVFEPQALASQAGLLAATAAVAALYPLWVAVSLPIAETLRREIVS